MRRFDPKHTTGDESVELYTQARGGTATVVGVATPQEAGFVLASIHREHPDRFLLAVAPEEESAEEICTAFALFAGRKNDPEIEPATSIRSAPLLSCGTPSLLPSERMSPYRSTKFVRDRHRTRRRIALLYSLTEPIRPHVLVSAAANLQQKIPPKEFFRQNSLYLIDGTEFEREELIGTLVKLGYSSVPSVEEPGEFAIRGSLVDFYSPIHSLPVRVEFFGDEIVSIRTFSHKTQKSIRKIEEAYVAPLYPLVLDERTKQRLMDTVERLSERQEVHPRFAAAMEEEIRSGIISDEIINLFPAAYGTASTIFGLLPSNTTIVSFDPYGMFETWSKRTLQYEAEYEEATKNGAIVLQPESYILTPEQVVSRVSRTSRISLSETMAQREAPEIAPLFPEPIFEARFEEHGALQDAQASSHEQKFKPLTTRITQLLRDGTLIMFLASGNKQAERTTEILNTLHIPTKNLYDTPLPEVIEQHPAAASVVVEGQLSSGFYCSDCAIAVISEEELFGIPARRKERAQPLEDAGEAFESFEELSEGDYVVHAEYGIGIYRGLRHMNIGKFEGDFLEIEYLGGDKLFLPATRIEKLHRYSSKEGAAPRLDKMGGASWQRTKSRVKKALRTVAEELLRLYAERKVAQGYRFNIPGTEFAEFESRFPFSETPHQIAAINAVITDMTSPKIMDRLICGDVGFGKTEVAMRAAFLAVLEGKQVAVLVPTTVLAFQHMQTFRERFLHEPVEIEMLSRLRTSAEQREILQRLKNGRIDIIIGTHRLLGKDVEFANLGLLIIDEEHRFGVRHKERIRQLKRTIDSMTLTATPIPRTLAHAFVGLKDLSVIETPPPGRHAIRTEIITFDKETIADAIRKELARGGQVYFVHNRVKSINTIANMIKRLVPEARIGIAHGQMEPAQLERVFLDFVKRHTNVLVSTTIIESGIDIPRVNTMFIHRADMMGLAQLYQLRGRVGRSSEQAMCYLIVPSLVSVGKKARSRLGALMRFAELGSGFKIARHDMEMRGAGAILGEKQWGQIDAVGFDLYMELLDEAVAELRGIARVEIEPEIKLPVSAFIPESYMQDPNSRLRFYKRFNSAETQAAIEQIMEEIEDLFGKAPEEVVLLGKLMQIKLTLKQLAVLKVEKGKEGFRLILDKHSCIDTSELLRDIMAGTNWLRPLPDDALMLMSDNVETPAEMLEDLAKLLLKLSKYCKD